jgi:dolichol-phosphate mannosyltransferase
MTSMLVDAFSKLPVIGYIVQHRFFKFGIVGLLGTLVNLMTLFFGQEFLFEFIDSEATRLYYSLSLAVFLATIHNYLLNRYWTWGDRKGKTRYGFWVQGGQYFLACGVAIALQFVFLITLSKFMHYLIANTISIVLAAVITYLINDLWTFSVRAYKKSQQR